MFRRALLLAFSSGVLAAVLLVPGVSLAQQEETEEAVVETTTAVETTGDTESTESTEETTTEESETDGIETGESSVDSRTESASIATSDSVNVEANTASRQAVYDRKKKSQECTTSSRSLAQAAAPPAPGCFRGDGGADTIVLPNGTTITYTEPSDGTISFTVSGGTFTGTIFVKGGPSSPGFACTFNNVTSGTCHTPVNPNNGKFYGVSHVDACPGQFFAPGEQPEGERKKKAEKKAEKEAAEEAAAEAAQAAARGEELAFTGFDSLWLLLIGSGLVATGFGLRWVRRST
jgi:chemotaxis protein histidine kinase CheA